MTLRCGTVRPAALRPDAQLLGVNGVDWFEQIGGRDVTWTTPTRLPGVELVVPRHYAQQAEILSTVSTAVAAAASPSPTASAPAAPAALRWRDCGDGFTCATLQVPLDHARPNGRQVSLALTRLPASGPGRRIGSVVLNPGGPGAPGTRYARAARRRIPAAVRELFDVVGFDPRGTGQSTRTHCLRAADVDPVVALDPHDTAAVDAAARLFARRCAAPDRELAAHLGTADTVLDLDDLRAALREPRLTYLGKSYGTYLGALYAEEFGTHVRALVLDGVVDPALDVVGSDVQQALGFENAFRRFARATCAGGRCGLGADPEAGYDRLVARLRNRPLPAGGGRRLTAGTAALGTADALYSQLDWPTLGGALAAAARGDGSGLLAYADDYEKRRPDGTLDGSFEANLVIGCVDRPYPRGAAADAETRRLTAAAPRFGPTVAALTRLCDAWPIPPSGTPHAVHAPQAPPVLLVANTDDPATPLAGAQSLSRQLDHDVLLVARRDGHTAYGGGRSGCVDRVVNAYLLTLALPAAGTACPAG